MLKVAINARLLSAHTLRGWNRYTINLIEHLSRLGVRPFLYSDQPIHADHLARLTPGSYEVRVAPAARYVIWEQRWLPQQCATDRVDLLHCPFHFGLSWSAPCPMILTLHDAIDQAYCFPRIAWRLRFAASSLRTSLHRWIARRAADHVITVSHHAKSDIVRYLGIPSDRVSVIYEAAEERFGRPVTALRSTEIQARYGLEHPYVLYVGGWEQRKNVPFLVRAFADAQLADFELVLVGGKSDEQAAMRETARSLGIEQTTKFLGWVSDEDLPALYQAASCFVYPSAYEGFGLQLCEAMSAGCAVFAANATSLPEILGGGGATFSLEGERELAELLRRLARDASWRDDLRARAKRRAAEFSWDRAAAATVEVYEAALQQRSARNRPVGSGV